MTKPDMVDRQMRLKAADRHTHRTDSQSNAVNTSYLCQKLKHNLPTVSTWRNCLKLLVSSRVKTWVNCSQ